MSDPEHHGVPADRHSSLPTIIQGGMGAGVSGWRLARAVSGSGQLGVVSGVGLDTMLVRRLEDGDAGGHLRHAMSRFPMPGFVDRILERFFRPEGRPPGAGYTTLRLLRPSIPLERQRLLMLAAFAEVSLAREGHVHPVGINLLTKIQLATLPTLYGALLGGAEYVLMGAGIPREIPGALDRLARHAPAEIRLDVAGESASGAREVLRFDPAAHGMRDQALRRPRFLAIVASDLLATVLARKATGRVDGFVVEGPRAGGHNAPPRGTTPPDGHGEVVYGARDVVRLQRIRDLGLPFWIAGGTGHPDALRTARAAGAAGVQVGTLFAYCDESGMHGDLKRSVLAHAARGAVRVRTDGRISPTGYPFKVVEWEAGHRAADRPTRVCDLGYLREAYRTPVGRVGFRCPAEPVAAWMRKGGDLQETAGRRCLCNALLATIGLGQLRDGRWIEPPIVTSGDDLAGIGRFLGGRTRYTAADVLDYLQGGARDGDEADGA